jgi:glycine cleavage system regulatory protein
MRSSLVLTVIGPDKTGLVESLSATVAEHGANWVESRMARLAGQFAGVLRVDVPAERQQALIDALDSLHGRDLSLVIQTADDPLTSERSCTLILELIGHDRPGIVRDVSRALAQHGVNVIELHTQVVSAPMTGDPLFEARVELRAPAEAEMDELRDALDHISSELDLDLTLVSD